MKGKRREEFTMEDASFVDDCKFEILLNMYAGPGNQGDCGFVHFIMVESRFV